MSRTPPRRLLPAVLGAAVVAGVGLGAVALSGRSDVRGEQSGRAQATTAATAPAPASTAPGAGSAPSGADPAVPAPQPADAPPSIAFLGDSLTVGVGAPPGRGFAWQTAERLGWSIAVVEGFSGSGFVAGGGGRPMPDRVPAVVAADPDVVVVAGGSNDVFGGYDAQAVGQAATALLTELRAGLPEARIVVVGPFPTSLAELAEPSPVRDAVRAATQTAGAQFVDAGAIVASAVSAQSDWERYISADGLHPNEQGYEVMAQALAVELAP